MQERSEFQLHEGDCVEGIRSHIADGSVDLVVTSPPYNLGIDYSKYEDSLEEDAYLSWTREWVGEIKRCLREDGSFFLNIAGSLREPMLPYRVIQMLVDEKFFCLQNTIHWIKSIAMPQADGSERQSGHYKPVNSARFLNDCHEFVFHLTKTGNVSLDRITTGVPYADKSNIERWAGTGGKDRKCRGNNWFIPYKTIVRRAKDRPHPATFPMELAKRCIDLHGKAEETVMLEPFLGIGHAGVAAKLAGVKSFTGFEIDPAYLAVAREELGELF